MVCSECSEAVQQRVHPDEAHKVKQSKSSKYMIWSPGIGAVPEGEGHQRDVWVGKKGENINWQRIRCSHHLKQLNLKLILKSLPR